MSVVVVSRGFIALPVVLFVTLVMLTVCVSRSYAGQVEAKDKTLLAQQEEQAVTFIDTQWRTYFNESAGVDLRTNAHQRTWCVLSKRRDIQRSWRDFVARIEATEAARIAERFWTWHKNLEIDRQDNLTALCNRLEYMKLLTQEPRPDHRGPGFRNSDRKDWEKEDHDNTPSQADYDEHDAKVNAYAAQRQAEADRFQAAIDRSARRRYEQDSLAEMQRHNEEMERQQRITNQRLDEQQARQPPAELDKSPSYVPSSEWSQSPQRWRRGQGMGPGGGQSMGPGGGLSMGPGSGLSMGPGGGLSMGPGGGLSIGPGGGLSIGPGGGLSIGPGGGMSIGPGGGQSIGPGGGLSMGPCGGLSLGPACR